MGKIEEERSIEKDWKRKVKENSLKVEKEERFCQEMKTKQKLAKIVTGTGSSVDSIRRQDCNTDGSGSRFL